MFLKKLLPLLFVTFPFGAHADTADNFNLRFGPIHALVGAVDLNFDIAVHPNWTIGPQFTYWHFTMNSTGSFSSNYDINVIGGGVRASWFKNGVFTDGLYVGPSLTFNSVEVKTSDSSGSVTGTATSIAASTLVGYGWFWDNFNIMLGGGLALPLGETKVKIKNSSGTDDNVSYARTGSLALEFTLGWTF